MAKVDLNTITSGFASTDALNTNFDTIEEGFENTLSRDGSTPNSMSADIDMDSNRILNLSAPVSDSEPVRIPDLALATYTDTTLPSQAGHAGDVLGTNGVAQLWITPDVSSITVADKAAAQAITPTTGASLVILSDDGAGRVFRALTGGSGYVDNGGSYCGTRFIPSGGDGTVCWDYVISGDADFAWFGATGDGATDDTVPVVSAIATELAFDGLGKTYAVTTNITTANVVDFKNAVFKRTAQTAGNSMFNFNGNLYLDNVKFDGNSATVATACHNVIVGNGCTESRITMCKSDNAKASAGFGSGLVYNIDFDITHSHHILGFESISNDSNGLELQSGSNITVLYGKQQGNGGTGIYANNFDISVDKKLYGLTIGHVTLTSNAGSGIVAGDFIEDDDISTAARFYSHTALENFNTRIFNCNIRDNEQYGAALSGRRVIFTGNTVYGNGVASASFFGGFVCNADDSVISSNIITLNYAWGGDFGGCVNTKFIGNNVRFNGATSHSGLNIGATLDVEVEGNYFEGNGPTTGTQIEIHNVDGNGSGSNFPYVSARTIIKANTFKLTSSRKAVVATDYCTGIQVKNNELTAGIVLSAFEILCPDAVTENNTFPGDQSMSLSQGGSSEIVVPDAFDYFSINTATAVEGILTYSMDVIGLDSIPWVNVTAGGTGFTSVPTVVFTGGGGTGAAATAYLYDETILGIRMTNYGTGYTSAPTMSFTGGGGSGATATAQWKLPVPTRKRLTLHTYQAVTVKRTGTYGPVVLSSSGADVSLITADMMNVIGFGGSWNVNSAKF